jgi:hypothetical protein
MRSGCPRKYPQGRQPVYVVFHVKLNGLWITSVDNFVVVWPPQTVMWIYLTSGLTGSRRASSTRRKLIWDRVGDLH